MPVIIVDDNEHITEFISFLLQDEGYQVLCFDRPDQALEHVRQSGIRPRCLITDFNLPQMNGYELHQAMLALVPGLQTLVISGRRVESEIRGLPFLQKPFSPETLLTAIRALQPQARESRACSH